MLFRFAASEFQVKMRAEEGKYCCVELAMERHPIESRGQLWVKYRDRTELLRPSIGVRTSSKFGHDIYQPAQCRLVPMNET